MNAKDSVTRMVARLTDVGFVATIESNTDTDIRYVVTNKTDNIWATTETFYISARKYDLTNRWNKHFAYSSNSVGNHDFQTSLTYSKMNSLINFAILSANVKVAN